MSRKSWTDYFYDIAFAVAERSTCPRRHVGAVLVSPANDIVSTGYNGAPRKQPDCYEVGCLMEHDHCVRTIHAEANALLRAAPERMVNGRLFITDFPCWPCSLLIANTGISRIYVARMYRNNPEVEKLFSEAGIIINTREEA